MSPDKKTFEYLKGKPLAPRDIQWTRAVDYWSTLKSDKNSFYDKTLIIDASIIEPQVTWGTSPEDVLTINSTIPDPETYSNNEKKKSVIRSLNYMGLEPGQRLTDIEIDTVFIGSCTNGRIEDLRKAAKILDGRKVNENVKAFVVPGSGLVKQEAEQEGLHRIFMSSGFEWRDPGCSMCLAMNADKLKPYERCASTSNRNFEGRQGRLGRTHLVSPEMAAAAAIKGKLFDVRKI
jgi:3-isopropylmalate/(R)-2-methylmalate dehydratase large subunit